MRNQTMYAKALFICSLLIVQSVSGQEVGRTWTREQIRQDLFTQHQHSLVFPQQEISKSFFQTSEFGQKKNVGLAVLYSLLLPGMGEFYVGSYGIGKYFAIAEGALWLSLGSLHWYATWLQDDARRYAVQHARINLDGKDDEYFVDIGNFNSVYEHNEEILRDRDAFKVYDPNSTFYWNWDSDLNRETYRDLRVSSDERFNDTRFVAAAIGVNHLISAINAARLTISHNKNVAQSDELHIRANVIGGLAHPHGIAISVSKNF